MGEIADSMINGEFDFYSGEYLDGESPGYPRTYKKGKIRPVYEEDTPAEKKIRSIRKELAILIKKKQQECETEKQKKSHAIILSARQEINKKYGKGWRERGLHANSDNQWTEEELKPFL